MFLKTMKPGAMAKLQQYPGLFDANRLLAANTLYAFDDVFTAPVHGYKNADDYWHRASAKLRLRGIQIPALALNAKNDPFVPASSLPTKNQVSNRVTLWQPDAGGHVGFTSDTFPSDLKPMPEAVMSWMTHG
jgi:predicted alpha/beta-fold hydrolase